MPGWCEMSPEQYQALMSTSIVLCAGMGSLPLLQDLSLTDINVILITHFHLDHCAALPWVVANMDFSGPIFMTHATKNIFYTMMKDILRMNQKDPARRLFNDRDLDNTMARITVINFHQTIDYDGIKITPYRCVPCTSLVNRTDLRLPICPLPLCHTHPPSLAAGSPCQPVLTRVHTPAATTCCAHSKPMQPKHFCTCGARTQSDGHAALHLARISSVCAMV